MNVVGVIAEFDPFHNGHEYLLVKAKSLTGANHAVAVLGGDFKQRGDVSMLPKSAKTECALLCGFDLVLELPTSFALASAERFAFGGVSVLAASGVVTHLAFGSECCDLKLLSRIADILSLPDTVDAIKSRMKDGTSFAAAREAVIAKALGEDARTALRSPNDILGVEYIKAIKRLNVNIEPVAVKRVGAAHGGGEAVGKYASASTIRKLILDGGDISGFVPAATADIIARERESGNLRVIDDRVMLSRLRTMKTDEISRLSEVREGMENRIKEAAQSETGFDSFAEAVSCRRYTHASARRAAINALLCFERSTLPESPRYVRILGAAGDARDLLASLKKNCSLPLVVKPADSRELIAQEETASGAAAVFAKNIHVCGDEYVKFPIFKK